MSDLWHGLKKENIGGSEIAALFDESPYTTVYKLWHQKRGNIERDDLDDVERIQGGTFLEVGIMNWANHRWKLDLYQPQVYVQHGSVKGMGCTPDCYSRSNLQLQAQIKNVDKWEFSEEKGWSSQGDTITAAPLHIMLQVQHEMECTGRAESLLIVCVGGNRLLRMWCERDEEIGAILRKKVAEFWTMPEPEPDFKRDGDSIRAIKKKLKHVDAVDWSDDKDLYKLLKKAKQTRVKIAQLQDDLEPIENEIFQAYEGKAIRCRDIFLRVINRAGSENRKGSISLKITMEGLPI